jgi:N6-adenosine-specific RNA methylase IME4
MASNVHFHPLADLFPLLAGEDFNALVSDIKANGLHEPIVLYKGKILDGRNRYRACREAKVRCRFETYQGSNPLAYVVSLNLNRRHLNESQRAMVAARLATLKNGQRKSASQICEGGLSQAEAAAMMNVSKRLVEQARIVHDKGTPALVLAAEQGKVAVSLAEKIAGAEADLQNKVVKRIERDDTKPFEAFRLAKAAKIEQRRLRKPTGKFRVFYADPPWSYSYGSMPTTNYGHHHTHYPTMSLEDICAVPVKDWAEDNAVLFLWATSPLLKEAFAVVEAWGFAYKSSFVWDKQIPVVGHYNGVAHELLLVCTRGACQPDVRKQFNSVVRERKTTHSKKPTVFYDIIETVYPHGRRVELFARNRRQGWDAWGNECRPCPSPSTQTYLKANATYPACRRANQPSDLAETPSAYSQ